MTPQTSQHPPKKIKKIFSALTPVFGKTVFLTFMTSSDLPTPPKKLKKKIEKNQL